MIKKFYEVKQKYRVLENHHYPGQSLYISLNLSCSNKIFSYSTVLAPLWTRLREDHLVSIVYTCYVFPCFRSLQGCFPNEVTKDNSHLLIGIILRFCLINDSTTFLSALFSKLKQNFGNSYVSLNLEVDRF